MVAQISSRLRGNNYFLCDSCFNLVLGTTFPKRRHHSTVGWDGTSDLVVEIPFPWALPHHVLWRQSDINELHVSRFHF